MGPPKGARAASASGWIYQAPLASGTQEISASRREGTKYNHETMDDARTVGPPNNEY